MMHVIEIIVFNVSFCNNFGLNDNLSVCVSRVEHVLSCVVCHLVLFQVDIHAKIIHLKIKKWRVLICLKILDGRYGSNTCQSKRTLFYRVHHLNIYF